MHSQSYKNIEILLNHPEVQRVTRDVNAKTMERCSFLPRKIDIFTHQQIVLEDMPHYQFAGDAEARKQLPDIMDNPVQRLVLASGNTGNTKNDSHSSILLPKNIGVVFSGGPAPGGHNVVCGIYDEAKRINMESRVFGFLLGPDGLIENRYIEITKAIVDRYRNMGGFSMLKTGRTKIDSRQKIERARQTCMNLKLNALVIIGGDDSNTNAAFLAQNFKKSGIQVIGVPKTIDGDLQVKTDDGEVLCAIPFGFHTAARTFSQSISNLTTDSASDVKYWHICKVMGRVASHLALESAFQTHANLTLIGEELADYVDHERIQAAQKEGTTDYNAYGITLRHVSRLICDTIVRRAACGKNYGVMILPEGLLEFINEIQVFIIKLNKIIADYNRIHDKDFHTSFPTLESKLDHLKRLARGMTDTGNIPIWNARDDELFNQLPSFFQEGLMVERDLHGNFQFSQVKTEHIVMDMVKEYLDFLKDQGKYKIGIEKTYYQSFFTSAGLDADLYGDALFINYDTDDFLLLKPAVISQKTLRQVLVSHGLVKKEETIPEPVLTIYKKSEPKLKTQFHFYGYDGRSADPTYFDCNYTYNLGMTAFHLIANGVTGQLAAIRNLEFGFEKWEPIGIPIAKLMHLEERKGRLELVIEKSLVDLDSKAFQMFKILREEWLAITSAEDHYRRPGPIVFSGNTVEDRPITLILNSIKE